MYIFRSSVRTTFKLSSTSHVSWQASESTKAFIKFKHNVHCTLTNLNEEMSAALRDGMKDVDQICSKVRQCLYEMEEHDINYRRFQSRSTPDLLLPIANEDFRNTGQNSSHPVSQSENHMRVVLNELIDKVGKDELPLQNEKNQEKSKEAIRVNETDDEYVEHLQKCLELIKDDVVEISHSFQQDYKNLSDEIEAETKEKQQRLEMKAAIISRNQITDYEEIVRKEDEFERQKEEIIKEKEEIARQKQLIAEQIAKINEQKKLLEEKESIETQKMQEKQQTTKQKKLNKDEVKSNEILDLQVIQHIAQQIAKINEHQKKMMEEKESSETQNMETKQKIAEQKEFNENKEEHDKKQKLQPQEIAEQKELYEDKLEIDEILSTQVIQQIAEHIAKINEQKKLNEDKLENNKTQNFEADANYEQKSVEPDEQTTNNAQSLTPKAGFESIVSKSRGILDIHEKLITQMEACDSLWEFEKKMMRDPNKQEAKPVEEEMQSKTEIKCEKSPSKISKSKPTKSRSKITNSKEKQKKKNETRTIKISKIDDKYNNKYKDSLWFSNKRKAYKENIEKDRKRPTSSSSQTKTRPSTRSLGNQSNKSICSGTYRHCSAHKSCNLVIENTRKIDPNKLTEKSRSFWMKFQTGQLQSGKSLNCVDILDELTAKDVEPIQSEYPRRDNFYVEKHSFVQNTFLYKMVNNKNNNKMLELLSSLEPPRIRCSSHKCTKCSSKHHDKEKHSKKSSKKRESDRKVSKHKLANDDVARKLRPYLTDPNLRYRTTITVMPVAVYFDGPPQLKEPTESNTSSSSASYLYTSGDFPRSTDTKKCDVRVKTKQMSPEQRKLWSTKYQKFAGQHLVSFIESLPPLPSEISEMKKAEQQKTNQLQTVELYKRQQRPMAKKPTNRSPPPKSKMLTPRSNETVAKNKQTLAASKTMKTNGDVLNNIKTMAKKNFIETDIKKIIQMIEMKIVDILSVPEKQNAEAFNSIEKEIRYVLRRMRKMEANKLGSAKEEKIHMLKLTALETILDCDKNKTSLWGDKHKKEMETLRAKIGTIESSRTSTATNESNEEKFEVTAVCSPTRKTREINEKSNDENKETSSTNDANKLKITEVIDESLQSSNSDEKDDKLNNESVLEMSQGIEGEIWIINKNIKNLKALNNKEEPKTCDNEEPKSKYNVEELEDECDIEEPEDKYKIEEHEDKCDTEEAEDNRQSQKKNSESENSNSLISQKQKDIVTQTEVKLSVTETDELKYNLLNKPSVQSYHSIMEFLDKLTCTSEDACSVLLHYRHDVRITDEEYVPIVYYPCLTYQTSEISSLVNEISTQTAVKTKAKRKLNKIETIESLEVAGQEHKRLLDTVYSVVFTVVYYALRLNYSCK